MKAAEAGFEIGAVLADRYAVRGCTLEGPAYVDYRVFDQDVEVELALWIMDPVLWPDEEARGSFERVVREMRGVLHQNLRRLFDVGRFDGGVYLTSQLGSPDGIAIRLGSGRTASELDVLRYANAMAEGLEALHAAGQVHGRMVPADLVEVAGVIKVSGAGLYGELDPAVAAERWGAERRYLAPEVLESGVADRRSDVYSMAAILCELASGVSSPDLAEATEQLAAEQLSLADLLARALSRAPDRRPGRPAELVERIRRLFVDDRVPTIKRPVLIRPEALRTVKSPALERPTVPTPVLPAIGEDDGEGLTIEETSPLFLDPSAAPRSPLFGPNQPTVTDRRVPPGFPPPPAASGPPVSGPPVSGPPVSGPPVSGPPVSGPPVSAPPVSAPPAPAGSGTAAPRQVTPVPVPVPVPAVSVPAVPFPPAVPAIDAGEATVPQGKLVLPLHSRRQPDEPHARATPILAAIDRPEMQPVLRPLSSLMSPEHGTNALGRYAPPRESDAHAPRGRLLLVIGLTAAAVLGGIALALALRDPDPVRPAPPPPPVRQPIAAGTAPAMPPPPARTEPCADGMALVIEPILDGAREPFCVDRHEWPGAGQPPRLGVTLEEAAAACAGRGARLCKPAEWEDACRGAGKASFPYGARYVDKKCNARGDEIASAGSFPECLSGSGAFDMSGNAAEWDADGGVRGASATDGTRGRCSEPRPVGKPRLRPRDRADVGFRCCAEPLAKVTPTR